jgi:hypothetical protein
LRCSKLSAFEIPDTPNCSFPFEYNNKTNSFCMIQDEKSFFCLNDSEEKLIECNLGKFLSIAGPMYYSAFNFQKTFEFDRNRFYEMNFFYLIADLKCDTINLEISLKPVDSNIFINVFNSKVDRENVSYSSWNEKKLCFYVETNIYEV